MDFEPEEQQIIDLLSKLKDQDGKYPKKMLASRRQVFLSQIASVGAGLGIGAGLKYVAKSSKGGLFHLSSISVSSILETILVLAIVAQTGVIAYSYRSKIADYMNTLSSSATTTEVSAPVIGSTEPAVVVSKTPTVAATKTASPSPSSTATTVTTAPSGSGGDNGGVTTNNTAPAPAVATSQPTNDNNGNHFGQTPRPTQEPINSEPTQGGGSGGGNGGGNGGKKP